VQQVSNKEVVKCAHCGCEVIFPNGQRSRHCPRCNNLIVVRKEKRDWDCPFCHDSGWVVIEKQINNFPYQFGYRCICDKGRNRPETGVPLAVDVDLNLRV